MQNNYLFLCILYIHMCVCVCILFFDMNLSKLQEMVRDREA